MSGVGRQERSSLVYLPCEESRSRNWRVNLGRGGRRARWGALYVPDPGKIHEEPSHPLSDPENPGRVRCRHSRRADSVHIGGLLTLPRPSEAAPERDTPFVRTVIAGCTDIDKLITDYNIKSLDTDLVTFSKNVQRSVRSAHGTIHIETTMRDLILAFLHISSSWVALSSVLELPEDVVGPLESLTSMGEEFRQWQEESKRMLDSILSVLHSVPKEYGKYLFRQGEARPADVQAEAAEAEKPVPKPAKSYSLRSEPEPKTSSEGQDKNYTILKRQGEYPPKYDMAQSIKDFIVNHILREEKDSENSETKRLGLKNLYEDIGEEKGEDYCGGFSPTSTEKGSNSSSDESTCAESSYTVEGEQDATDRVEDESECPWKNNFSRIMEKDMEEDHYGENLKAQIAEREESKQDGSGDSVSDSIHLINFKILLRKKRNYRDFSRSQILSRRLSPRALSRKSIGFYGDVTYFNMALNDNVRVKLMDILKFIEEVDLKYLITDGTEDQIARIKESVIHPISLLTCWVKSGIYKALTPFLEDIQNAFCLARIENKADCMILVAANLIELMFINCIYRELDLF